MSSTDVNDNDSSNNGDGFRNDALPPPSGASQLLGLFAPPPGLAGSTAESSSGDGPGIKIGSPPSAPAHAPTSTGSSERYDFSSSPTKNSAGSVQSLMGLFRPPLMAQAQAVMGTSTEHDNDDEGEEIATKFNVGVLNDGHGSSEPQTENTHGAEPLSSLFLPSKSRPELAERQVTAPRSNKTLNGTGGNGNVFTEYTPLMSSQTSMGSMDTSPYMGFSVSSIDVTPKTHRVTRKTTLAGSGAHQRLPSVVLPAIVETVGIDAANTAGRCCGKLSKRCILNAIKTVATECAKPASYIGAFMFVFYHVVFCLAMGSAIIRPHNPTSVLGLMTKTAALSIISGASVYWFSISNQLPALYPTTDLFLAPFLANLAVIVDNTLAADKNISPEENDVVFLTTFAVLSGIGIFSSGFLILLASVFKLANLGSFLPFPVVCGFFSAVGVLTWALAIAVDTSGKTIGHILKSGDPSLYLKTIIHHSPSVAIASVLKYLGPKNPFYVVVIILGSIGLFYVIMFISGISLEDARKDGWFWSHDDLVYIHSISEVGFDTWSPPAPFGVWNELRNGMVHWGAVYNGLSTAIALGFLYLIRCSVHATALKKNIANLSKTVIDDDVSESSPPISRMQRPSHKAQFSEAIDIEAVMASPPVTETSSNKKKMKVVHAEPSNIALKEILLQYGYSQFVSAFVGGFAITPSVAAAPTMYSLGADGVAPQVGSVLLLLVFYLTDFRIVQYMPKPVFSCMLVLSFIDTVFTWLYKSYFKTKSKVEWLVVPAIIVCAFAVDLLSSVFVGVALSTLIFVASFNQSGVVKYAATGLTIHSTIERPVKSADWLNENGHAIQIVVLQNYLFFGNASSVYAYICTMFDTNPGLSDYLIDFKPKYIIIDCTMVTGCDTSAVDVFTDIKILCKTNKCKLMMSGMSIRLRAILSLGGFKPDTGDKSKRRVRFFTNLDAALGKAEDLLLEHMFETKDPLSFGSQRRLLSESDNGFRMALRHIDEQHGDCFAMDLLGLQEYTLVVELEPGDDLYNVVESQSMGRGLFFVETGVLKVVQDTTATLTRGSVVSINTFSNNSISELNARSIGRSVMDRAQYLGPDSHSFRLARIGPGWIAGAHEAVSGVRRQGNYVAVTQCRLHHLPYNSLNSIEKENPSLVLILYKLLSLMLARRQEATIGQLATLHSIMTSPPHR